MKLDDIFDKSRVFLYKGRYYERARYWQDDAVEFREILSFNDYDYVEDQALITELRIAADTEGIKY